MSALINFSETAQKYIGRKPISALVLDVQVIEEPCVQIYTPIVIEGRSATDGVQNLVEISQPALNMPKIFLTPAFQRQFGLPDELKFTVEGFIKKILALSNIQPKINQTCKIPTRSN